MRRVSLSGLLGSPGKAMPPRSSQPSGASHRRRLSRISPEQIEDVERRRAQLMRSNTGWGASNLDGAQSGDELATMIVAAANERRVRPAHRLACRRGLVKAFGCVRGCVCACCDLALALSSARVGARLP